MRKIAQLEAAPRIRVITDNDYAGDPDGLVQLAHLVLSPSADVRAVISSHLRHDVPWPVPEFPSAKGASLAQRVVDLAKSGYHIPVFAGSEVGMSSIDQPTESAAVDFIIDEAMNGDQSLPLYMVCGGSLTSIASAYLKEPRIADRLILVWIGGPGYNGNQASEPEFNLSLDVNAAQVVFNNSDLTLWQVPESTYATVLVSQAEVIKRMDRSGELGSFIWSEYKGIHDFIHSIGMNLGEALVFGDSPLVLLTTLQNAIQGQPASSNSEWLPAPQINNQGFYEGTHENRLVRVFTSLDVRLMVEDFFVKLELLG
jgi:inosine-uridine nucleoside N-ribohydrolase